MIRQWLVWFAGLLLHGLSIGTLWTDPDTAPDTHFNVQLDMRDADGKLSDGLEEGWARLKAPGRWLHDAKNLTREWFEVVHPKTASRIAGAANWVSMLIGGLVGGFTVWVL